MIVLDLQIDGGAEHFKIAIDKTAQEISSFKKLFSLFINYFEGKDLGLKHFKGKKSPVQRIYESQGSLIQGNWQTSAIYDTWKSKNWATERKYNVPIPSKSQQILSGFTLYNLLDSTAPRAIRKATDTEMEYGTDIEYAYENQTKRKILDFYPEMEDEMRQITAAFIGSIEEKTLEWEELD